MGQAICFILFLVVAGIWWGIKQIMKEAEESNKGSAVAPALPKPKPVEKLTIPEENCRCELEDIASSIKGATLFLRDGGYVKVRDNAGRLVFTQRTDKVESLVGDLDPLVMMAKYPGIKRAMVYDMSFDRSLTNITGVWDFDMISGFVTVETFATRNQDHLVEKIEIPDELLEMSISTSPVSDSIVETILDRVDANDAQVTDGLNVVQDIEKLFAFSEAANG